MVESVLIAAPDEQLWRLLARRGVGRSEFDVGGKIRDGNDSLRACPAEELPAWLL